MSASRGETRVLLVEDHPVNQKVVSKMLERLACTVDVAADGELAVERAENGYDLILMDCSMPRMDGFEATRRIRALASAVRATPIVALTAHATEGDRQRCIVAGMNAWLPKPVSQDQLVGALQQYTEWSNAKPEPSPGILDEDSVQTLLGLGGPDDPDFFTSLVDEFARAASLAIATARQHLKAMELPELRRTVHRLAGSAGTMGAALARDACRRIELADPADLAERGVDWLEALEREVERATVELSNRGVGGPRTP